VDLRDQAVDPHLPPRSPMQDEMSRAAQLRVEVLLYFGNFCHTEISELQEGVKDAKWALELVGNGERR